MQQVIDTWPQAARDTANKLARLIRDEATRLEAAPLTETTKWGQPAFLTEVTKSGTTIRLGWSEKDPGAIRLYVHCQTNLVDQWRARFPELTCEGNRAIALPLDQPLPQSPLRSCVSMALTYHRAKQSRPNVRP